MNINRLNELFESSNETKVVIANKVGVTTQTLANVLSGADAKVSTIEALAKCFGVSVGYLFEEDGYPSNDNEVRTKLEEAQKEIAILKKMLENASRKPRRVVIELDVDDDEFIKMGLKDKIIQILDK